MDTGNSGSAETHLTPALARAIARWLLFLYLLVLPVTNAFELHQWLPWPFLCLLLSLPLSLLTLLISPRLRVSFDRPDFWLAMFMLVVTFSSLINIFDTGGSASSKQVSHFLSYFGIIIIYYFSLKLLLIAAAVDEQWVLSRAMVSYVMIILFSYVEFAGKSFLGFDIDQYIPRIFDYEYAPTLGALVIRSRGLASESGNYALYLEVLMPLLVAQSWLRGKHLLSIVLAVMGIVALIITFSAAAWVALPLATVVTVLIRSLIDPGKHSVAPVLGVIALAVGLPMLVVAVLAYFVDMSLVSGILGKLAFDDSASSVDRQSRWQNALILFQDSPLIGFGAGTFLEGGRLQVGVVSWWLQILVEGGVLGLICILIGFLAGAYKNAIDPRIRHGGYGIAILATSVHYAVISDYWLPWLWFCVALLFRTNREASAGVAVTEGRILGLNR